MSLASLNEAAGPLRDAVALAALARDCAASGVERRALHLPLSRLPAELRGARHRRLLDETIAPLLRPTRARVFALPGGDLVALSPPPGEHLAAVRDALARLLPPGFAPPLLRLPAEAAALLAVVEEALGLDAAPAAPAPRRARRRRPRRAGRGAAHPRHRRRRRPPAPPPDLPPPPRRRRAGAGSAGDPRRDGGAGRAAAARPRARPGLPEDRATLVLLGADTPAAIAWGWQRGITRFSGRLMRG